jgi:hypothetical protein
MMAEDWEQIAMAESCGCFTYAYQHLVPDGELGMDAHFTEVSRLRCTRCGQQWLRCFYEAEAFSESGRWYLGAISTAQASRLTVASAKAILEGLSWYYYGGSYYQGQQGKTSGAIALYSGR